MITIIILPSIRCMTIVLLQIRLLTEILVAHHGTRRFRMLKVEAALSYRFVADSKLVDNSVAGVVEGVPKGREVACCGG